MFVFSHPAVHLWLNPSVVWTHALSSCFPVVLHRDASIQTCFCYKKRKLPLSLSHSTHVLKLFFHDFLLFFTRVQLCSHRGVGSVPENQRSGTTGCSVCHYEVFGFPAYMCVHVCACHSWHSTPAQSVILCVHQAGAGTLTTVEAAGMLSFIQ